MECDYIKDCDYYSKTGRTCNDDGGAYGEGHPGCYNNMALVYEKTRRARVFTGMACNADCLMCYNQGRQSHRSKQDMMRQIDIAANEGMEAIDFSGGEPTIVKELPELIAYAHTQGLRVGMVTNGMRLADKEYSDLLVAKGLNEVLFSVHGSSAGEHDAITRVPGSFEKMMGGIQNIKEAGIMLRFNTTVSRVNYASLLKHAEIFNELKPYNVNFILFNDWGLSQEVVDKYCVKYSLAEPHLHKAIDAIKDTVPAINVRYIPFCFMKGYEEYVCDYPQKIHDPFEWSQKLLSLFGEEKPNTVWKWYAERVYGFLKKPSFDIEDLYVTVRRRRRFIKTSACSLCRYEPICDGLEKGYAKANGVNELKPTYPQAGKLIDPLKFRKRYQKKVNEALYGRC